MPRRRLRSLLEAQATTLGSHTEACTLVWAALDVGTSQERRRFAWRLLQEQSALAAMSAKARGQATLKRMLPYLDDEEGRCFVQSLLESDAPKGKPVQGKSVDKSRINAPRKNTSGLSMV